MLSNAVYLILRGTKLNPIRLAFAADMRFRTILLLPREARQPLGCDLAAARWSSANNRPGTGYGRLLQADHVCSFMVSVTAVCTVQVICGLAGSG